MKIDTMRAVDKWVGISLCFLLSGVAAAGSLFLKRRGKQNPRKILLIKLSELGAIVLTMPLIKRLQADLPGSDIHFLTFKKNREIFGFPELLINQDKVLTLRDTSLRAFLWDSLCVVRKMKQEQFDIVLDLEFFSRCSAILAWLSFAAIRVGFYRYTFEGLYRGNLLTHRVQLNPLLHVSRSFYSLGEVLREDEKMSPELAQAPDAALMVLPSFQSRPDVKAQLDSLLEPIKDWREKTIFLINPGEGNLPLREWPLENFLRVARWLLEDPRYAVVLVGSDRSKKDALLFDGIVMAEKPGGLSPVVRCLNLTGETSLAQLMELFLISGWLISNDCGLAHLAALTPIKKITIFGPESPQIFSPLGERAFILTSGLPCSPCLSALNHRASACRDNLCLKAVSPETVIKLIRQQN